MALSKDRVLNPELIRAADQHAKQHVGCTLGRPVFTSSKAHQAWRKQFKEHSGSWPPATWLPKEKPAEPTPTPPAAVAESTQLQPFLFDVEETPVIKKRRPPRRKSLSGH